MQALLSRQATQQATERTQGRRMRKPRRYTCRATSNQGQ